MSQVNPMDLEGDQVQNWLAWRNNIERYLSSGDNHNNAPDVSATKFLCLFGNTANQITNRLELTKAELNDVDTLLERFESHFIPRDNVTQHRHVLFNQKQAPNESIEEYITILKRLAEGCEWGEKTDDVVKTVFINGISDDVLRNKLLNENDLSLETTISYSLMAEQIRTICLGVETNILDEEKEERSIRKYCGYCGFKHERNKCPAYKKVCNVCKKPNHFAKMCRNRKHEGFVFV